MRADHFAELLGRPRGSRLESARPRGRGPGRREVERAEAEARRLEAEFMRNHGSSGSEFFTVPETQGRPLAFSRALTSPSVTKTTNIEGGGLKLEHGGGRGSRKTAAGRGAGAGVANAGLTLEQRDIGTGLTHHGGNGEAVVAWSECGGTDQQAIRARAGRDGRLSKTTLEPIPASETSAPLKFRPVTSRDEGNSVGRRSIGCRCGSVAIDALDDRSALTWSVKAPIGLNSELSNAPEPGRAKARRLDSTLRRGRGSRHCWSPSPRR